MARVLYITNGLSGGLNASFDLARRVAAAGHQIQYLGHGDCGTQINAEGYEYTQVTLDKQAVEAVRHRMAEVGRIRALPTARKQRSQLVASAEIAEAVQAISPDALIIDVEAHVAILQTRALGIPTLLKSDWFSMDRVSGHPPMHVPLSFPGSFKERRIADAAWIKALGERLFENTVGQLRPGPLLRRFAPYRYNTISRPDLRQVAKAHGVDLRALTSQTQWLRPHVYPELAMMTSTAHELDFPGASRSTMSVGPFVHRRRVDAVVSQSDRERWQLFEARNRESGRPLLYCSFGTMVAGTEVLIDRVIQAVAQRPEWDLVVGLGGRGHEPQGADHDHILALDYAPQLDVLERANGAIVHGGINNISECLSLGVPMLVDPNGPGDQQGNAARVAYHGVGIRASIADCSLEEIATNIERLLSDQALSSRVQSMRTAFASYQDSRILEATIDQLVAGTLDATIL